MKRHHHSLLQRRRVEFGGADAARRITTPVTRAQPTGLQAGDGYDWLRQIKQFQATRRVMRANRTGS
ncbi:hypothetical protein ACFPPA_08985 [Rhodanobacter ginsengisoli]|uniref:Uncharacterized protein n=1 Tax=Rhodanobacter ginsengisoli TaxID=418646 RepID=A0ABW0QNL6_9GAMM